MKHRVNGFILVGLLLIAAALLLTLYNLYDQQRAARSVKQVAEKLQERIPKRNTEETPIYTETDINQEIEIPNYILNPKMEMPKETIDDEEYIGILSIPTLDLVLPVISQWSYTKLKIAPNCYSGSAYTGDIVIAGHNYESHFGNLKLLHEGDSVTFTDVDGNVFEYRVVELEIINSDAVDEMKTGDWDLTMFTCTVGGQKRVTVRCKEI